MAPMARAAAGEIDANAARSSSSTGCTPRHVGASERLSHENCRVALTTFSISSDHVFAPRDSCPLRARHSRRTGGPGSRCV